MDDLDACDTLLSELQRYVLDGDNSPQEVVRRIGAARRHLTRLPRLPFSDEFVSKEDAPARMALAFRYCQDWATSGDSAVNADLYEKGLIHMLNGAPSELRVTGVRIGRADGTDGEVQLSNGATLGGLLKIVAEASPMAMSATITVAIGGKSNAHLKEQDKQAHNPANSARDTGQGAADG